ncbi:MAG: STAS domain-containing protein [Anaerolineaceae bacterium]|nr:STAS domain-containing protein [Anaerolineaceae bacterium]
MEISVTNYKRCEIVKAVGRVDSSTSSILLTTFNSIIDKKRYRIVFNMSDVNFISSAGLRVLLTTQKTCKRYNRGELVLCNVPENIMAALDLSGFSVLFRIFNTDLEAVGNF